MLFVIVAVILLGAAVVVLLGGASALTGGHGDDGGHGRRATGTLIALVIAGGAFVLVLFVVVGGGLLGARGSGHRDEVTEPADRSAPAATTPPTSLPSTDLVVPSAISPEGSAQRSPSFACGRPTRPRSPTCPCWTGSPTAPCSG